jgi:hypothetical protein
MRKEVNLACYTRGTVEYEYIISREKKQVNAYGQISSRQGLPGILDRIQDLD